MHDSESPLRALMAEGGAIPHSAVATLADARRDPDAVAILEGDDGGQIFVVVPANLVSCSADVLQQLAVDIDAMFWGDPTMTRVVYERLHKGDFVAGGMGGGMVTDGVWVHPEIVERGLAPAVVDVVEGRAHRLIV